MSKGDVVRVGDLLDVVGRRLGLDSAAKAGRIWRAWPEIVGEALARQVEPSSLRGGVLRLRTESPAWANEAIYLSEDIRRRVNGFLRDEAVAEVRVWTAPGRIRRQEDRSAREASRVVDVGPRPAPARHPAEALERARAAWARRRAARR